MKHLVMAAALALLATPAAAQQFDGVWKARLQQPLGTSDLELVITNGRYSLLGVLTTPEGYQYQTYQSGNAAFHAPDTLRFVVEDYEPKVYLGNPMSRPPNSNMKVLASDANSMTLLDNVCVTAAAPNVCTIVYQRTQ